MFFTSPTTRRGRSSRSSRARPCRRPRPAHVLLLRHVRRAPPADGRSRLLPGRRLRPVRWRPVLPVRGKWSRSGNERHCKSRSVTPSVGSRSPGKKYERTRASSSRRSHSRKLPWGVKLESNPRRNGRLPDPRTLLGHRRGPDWRRRNAFKRRFRAGSEEPLFGTR